MQHLDQRERQVIICSASRSRNRAERMKELLNWAISDVYPGKAGVWWELGCREWMREALLGGYLSGIRPRRIWVQWSSCTVAFFNMYSYTGGNIKIRKLQLFIWLPERAAAQTCSPSAFQAMQYGSRTTAVSVTNENFYFKHQLSIYCIRQHKTSVFLRNLILSIMVTQGHDSCSQKVYKTVLPSLDDPDKSIMT